MKNVPFLSSGKKWFLKQSTVIKIVTVFIFIAFIWFAYTKIFTAGSDKIQYQTATAEKGTLVVSVTGSGNVSTTNSTSASTQATGVISKVYVKDGDQVQTGDKIAEIDLDLLGKQRAAQALANYQSANNNLDAAKANLYTTQSDMFAKWKIFYDLATSSTYQNSDGTPNNDNRGLAQFHIPQDDWLAAEAKYKNQQNVVIQAQTAVNSAWYNYQQNSSTVYAPISGTVTGLALRVGQVIAESINSSTNTQNSTKIASVKTDALPTVIINLSEIDVPKVKVGMKATVTFDTFPDKTFAGKVVSVDTTGVVSSGVTNYPVAVELENKSDSILPNMAASANIITQTKDNVLLVPTSGVQTQNGESTVRVMKNGQPQTVTVDIGLSSDTQTEIASGIKEGDTVITGITQTGTTSSGQTSPFGTFGGGGGAFRLGGGGTRNNR